MARSRKKIRKNITSMLQSHRNRRHLVLGVIPVALILVTLVTWSLHVNAITLSDDPICGMEEHTHTADCYAWVSEDDSTETMGTITTSATSSTEADGTETAGTETAGTETVGTEAASESVTEELTESETQTEEVTEEGTATEAVTEEETATEAVIEEKISETATESVILEGTEAVYASTEMEATEEVEETPQEGDTKIEDGVTYVYTLTCGKEEHTHTDECFEDESESIWTNFGIMLMSLGEEGSESETVSEEETSSSNATEPEVTSTTTVDSLYTDFECTTSLANSSVSWTTSNVSYADGSFTMSLTAAFTLTGTDIQQPSETTYATYYISLPTGFTVSDDVLNVKYTGKDSDNNEAYHYYFRYDDTYGYYIEIVFDIADYITKNGSSSSTLEGSITYTQYTIDKSYVDTTTKKDTVIFNETLGIEVSTDEIKKEDNESWVQDLTVTKTAAAYDEENNSITYTVTISSESGTGVITLADLLSFVNNTTYADDMSVYSVTVDSVDYQQCYYYSNQYGSWTSWSNGTSVTKVDNSTSITEDTTVGTAYSYSTTFTDSDITITLAPLAGAGTATALNGSTEVVSDRYVLTYTVKFNSGTTFDSKVTNNATATSEKNGDTVTDTATYTSSVVSSFVEKKGIYDADTGLITWTITLNENGADITGYILEDSMFSMAVGDIYVSYSYTDSTTGETSKGTSTEYTATNTDGDYELIKDTNGKVSSIEFLAVDDDKDGTSDSNTRTYTIIFQTDSGISMGESSIWIYNEVKVYDDEENLIDTDSSSVNAYSGGEIKKEVSAATDTVTDNGVITRVLTWKSTLTVPSAGIAGGSTIIDYLGSEWTYTNTDSIKQWYTYSQITDFLGGIVTNGIVVTPTDNTADTTYPYTTTDGQTITQNYTLYAYDATIGKWVEYSDLINTGNTYSSDKFTAWKIELSSDTEIAGSGKISFSYSSTADISDIDKSQNYTNYIYVNNMSANATYTEYEKVYKTDGKGNTGTTTTTDGDGTVTWKVYVYANELTSNSGDFEITDKLPAGLTLSSVTVDLGWTGQTVTFSTDSGSSYTYTETLNGQSVKVEVAEGTGDDANKTIVTTTVPYNAYYIVSGSSNPYIVLTYTAVIDSWNDSMTESVTYTLNNTVSVSLGNSDYGSDEQEQIITHTYVDQGETTTYTHDKVEKSVDTSGFGNDNWINYKVVLNLDGEKLNEGNNLTFTDVLYTYSGLYAELIYSSVTFYKLEKITDPSSYDADSIYTYTESDGTAAYYKMEELALDWDYAESYTNSWSTTNISHTLTAEVPDSTPILVKYTYFITADDNVTWIYLENNASLAGDSGISGSDSTETSTAYKEYEVTGSITNAGGLTVIKSGLHTSNFIQGVTFALYKYNSSDETWEDTGVIYTTNSSGSFSVTPYSDTTTDPKTTYSWYSSNTLYYLVETSTPSGYLLDSDTKYYFYWSDSSGSVTYPRDWDKSTNVSAVAPEIATNLNISNTPITTFTLTKTDTSDSTTVLSNAWFAVYEYAGINSSGDDVWSRIGTYVTDSSGKISITYDESMYTFNKAYKITEITPASGYNIGNGDVTEFYFYWSSDSYDAQPQPSGWTAGTTGTTYDTAIDLSSKSQEVTATNTKTSTTIAVSKAWIDADGNLMTERDLTNFSSTARLYYYLLDKDGNPYSSTTSASSQELVTLTTTEGEEADTVATLYSYVPSSGVSLSGSNWVSLEKIDITSFISAITDEDYSPYIEAVVVGGDTPTELQLIIQAKGSDNSYPVIASVRPVIESVDSTTTTYTVKFNVSDIMSQIEANGYTVNDIASMCMALNQSGNTATVTSLQVLIPAATLMKQDISSGSATTNYNWIASIYIKDNSDIIAALQEEGARIRITYEYTSGSQIGIGIQDATENYNSFTAYTSVNSLGVAEVLVSDIISASKESEEIFWENGVVNIYVQGTGTNSLVGTVTGLDIIVPATSTTTSQTYYVVESDTTSSSISSWESYFSGDSEVQEALRDSEAVIYIEYECKKSIPDWINVGIQYYYISNGDYPWDYYSIVSQISVGTSYIAIPVTSILSGTIYSLDNYNAVIVQGGYNQGNNGTFTIKSVKILLPYSSADSISGVIADVNIEGIMLYHPDIDGIVIYNNIGTYGASNWNAIMNTEGTYTDIDSANGNTLHGYAFFDAVYADLASDVVIALSDVSVPDGTDAETLLKNLALLIQGDASSGYSNTIANVTPSNVTYDSTTKTATLTYSGSSIKTALASAAAQYDSAADVSADYNSICLALEGDYYETVFTAMVTDLSVVSETFNTLTDTYTDAALLGNFYGGQPYTTTDSYNNTVYYDVTLSNDNNWSAAFANLPVSFTDDEGTVWYYYYYFVETGYTADSNAYTTTYSQISGINEGGEIIIVNNATAYVLPGSGGIGTGVFHICGILVLGLGVVLIIILKIKQGENDVINRQASRYP